LLTTEVNADFLLNNTNRQQELYLGYNFTFDKRDFKGFPLNGYLAKIGIENALVSSVKTSQPTFMLKSSVSRYFRIKGAFYASLNATARYYSLQHAPYNKQRALGYGKDYIRGYELKVIDGNHFVLGKSELKYRFLNKKYKFLPGVKNYELLPVALFLSSFFDMGYVKKVLPATSTADDNKLPNSFQYGYGAGLNVVMFYDYCFRAEYSFDRYMNNRMYFSFVASM